MARRPQEDPRITDLRRYKKAREQAKRTPPPKPPHQRGQGILGSNPRAGLILTLVAVAVLLFFVLPTFL